MSDDNKPITRKQFIKQLRRYQKGSISRRQFLGVTGLGMATTVMAAAVPSLLPRKAFAAPNIGDRVVLATWPNYHDQANFEAFTEATGAYVQVNVFGSNEEMLAKLQAGGSGWDVFVPTNYTITTYVGENLIEPLDLAKLSNYRADAFDPRFSDAGTVDGKLYAVPKNWGTTGFVVNNKHNKGARMTSWKDFWDRTRNDYSSRTMVHDYQLTTIGNALKYFGYSFNSVDPDRTRRRRETVARGQTAPVCDQQRLPAAAAQWRRLDVDVLDRRRQAAQHRYSDDGIRARGRRVAKSGATTTPCQRGAEHREAGYALIDFMLDPAVNAREVLAHGYPVADSRTNALLPKELLEDPILYPAQELLDALEFGAAATLTDPNRAELLARFKSA